MKEKKEAEVKKREIERKSGRADHDRLVVWLVASPFEHEEGPCGASKYETFRASTSLINGARHARLSLSLSSWSCYMPYTYISCRGASTPGIECIDDWFSSKRRAKKEKRGGH